MSERKEPRLGQLENVEKEDRIPTLRDIVHPGHKHIPTWSRDNPDAQEQEKDPVDSSSKYNEPRSAVIPDAVLKDTKSENEHTRARDDLDELNYRLQTPRISKTDRSDVRVADGSPETFERDEPDPSDTCDLSFAEPEQSEPKSTQQGRTLEIPATKSESIIPKLFSDELSEYEDFSAEDLDIITELTEASQDGKSPDTEEASPSLDETESNQSNAALEDDDAMSLKIDDLIDRILTEIVPVLRNRVREFIEQAIDENLNDR